MGILISQVLCCAIWEEAEIHGRGTEVCDHHCMGASASLGCLEQKGVQKILSDYISAKISGSPLRQMAASVPIAGTC